jgi:PhnB protein
VTQNQSTTGVTRIEPYLYYEDVARALDWLSRAFGFREAGERQTSDEGVVTHAAMEHDGGVLMMGHPGPEYQAPRRSGQRHCSFYVYVSDLEAHFQRAKAAGATILEMPETTEYGHRRYGAEDLEGQHWYFAQPL